GGGRPVTGVGKYCGGVGGGGAAADGGVGGKRGAAGGGAPGRAGAGPPRPLPRRYHLPERQARRYVERAQAVGTLDVPSPTVAFTVKLPVSLLHHLRAHARDSGRTLSGIVAQAIEEFLHRVRAGPGGG